MRRLTDPAVLITVLTLATSCATRTSETRVADLNLGWPRENPRVRLVRVIDTDPPQQRRWLDWLGDDDSRPSFVRPFGVAWDADAILVADPGARRVARIEKNGRISWSREGAFLQPTGVARCDQGIVVTDSRAGTVVVLDDRLEPGRRIAEGLLRPTGVACAGAGIVVVDTGSHEVVVIDPAGRRSVMGKRGEGPAEFNFPTSVAVDGGSLWVGDTLNFRVQRLDLATGRFLDSFGRLGDGPGDMPRGKAVEVDPEGRIWVSDAVLDAVSLFDSGGRLLLSIGAKGSAPGQFSFPAGIAIRPDGVVAVADSLNRRIQILEILPGEDEG